MLVAPIAGRWLAPLSPFPVLGKHAHMHAQAFQADQFSKWQPVKARLRLTGNPRDQLREFLTEVILTPAGKVDDLRAVEQLAKLCGWNQPEKFEHGASKVEGRFAWIAVPPTVEAYLRTLSQHAARQWFAVRCAAGERDIPRNEPMPITVSGIRARLAELGNWRARLL